MIVIEDKFTRREKEIENTQCAEINRQKIGAESPLPAKD
jgi:hypothetical protein